MRSIETEQSLVKRPVPWVEVCRPFVQILLAQRAAPRVGRLGVEGPSPFRQLQLHRVIRRVAWIRIHAYDSELRIDDNQILRESSVSD
jgi:hypothetical protein